MADHRVFFDHDPEIGRTVWLIFDDQGNLKGAHVEQEIDAILDANAEAEKASHGVRFGDYQRVASVPLTFFEKTGLGDAIDGGDKRYLSKVLNDSDNSRFRTSRGRV
ncbi:MAG: hypothetical protein E5X94_00630 [Mesorhizobium sp.]|uniref:hypothetical protein n=1 Tax=unclassified Mesorhizobium TaxID=325217 RepID=UPI000FCB6918|nr:MULTISPECIES: hypothetical protein [unclassified Mesorhizobium]RUW04045.1 hypothetical protein EOA49_00520 [Mesorhizobium sp. M1A.F.Ca.IN.020.04.1.1]RUW04108.1 hypothetical protein EOA49_00855 [Mesorhizobium sp. M1A.F.Ca.IN.020.04.1.1]TIN82756.1 MAG: hypothetical protein E5X97_29055 [Mesorhizobium sp.]TIN88344.1 MAG: hypothetical protein E5X94_00630 [Mesorhizobium sp.]